MVAPAIIGGLISVGTQLCALIVYCVCVCVCVSVSSLYWIHKVFEIKKTGESKNES